MMAAPRGVVEIETGPEELARLEAIARSRIEPAIDLMGLARSAQWFFMQQDA